MVVKTAIDISVKVHVPPEGQIKQLGDDLIIERELCNKNYVTRKISKR